MACPHCGSDEGTWLDRSFVCDADGNEIPEESHATRCTSCGKNVEAPKDYYLPCVGSVPPAVRAERARRCVSHHYACDCREHHFAELERQNEALREEITRLFKVHATEALFRNKCLLLQQQNNELNWRLDQLTEEVADLDQKIAQMKNAFQSLPGQTK